MPSIRERIANPTLKGVLIEFIIIFLGVYLAYLFNDLQEMQRERRTQIKYCETLIKEFMLLDALLAQQQETIGARFEPVLAAIEAGERPALNAEPLFFDFQGLTIESAFRNDENFSALPEFILANLVGGHTAILSIRSRVADFRAHLTALDVAGGDPARLYGDGGALKAELRWYPSLIREVSSINGQLREALKVAIPALQEHKGELESAWWW